MAIGESWKFCQTHLLPLIVGLCGFALEVPHFLVQLVRSLLLLTTRVVCLALEVSLHPQILPQVIDCVL